MTREWIVRPLAQADIDDAVTWYEQQQFGLGSRFLDVLDHILKRIRDTSRNSRQFPAKFDALCSTRFRTRCIFGRQNKPS